MSYYNFYIDLNYRVGVHFRQNVAKKTRKKSKIASNKSYLQLNFLQKTQWTHISIPPPPEMELGAPNI